MPVLLKQLWRHVVQRLLLRRIHLKDVLLSKAVLLGRTIHPGGTDCRKDVFGLHYLRIVRIHHELLVRGDGC